MRDGGQAVERPITLVLDNARYQRHARVMAEAARLAMTRLGSPTCAPHRNLIARLGKCVQADGLGSEYRWCLPGRYDPKFGPLNQAISDCLADTSGRHQARLNTLLTAKFPVFKSAASIINCETRGV
ncbi:MAG: hypothetical protein M0Z53_13305 [Thermaerobacter sp.]|nr:hypothetical protein [Thermaerobacter sp.]